MTAVLIERAADDAQRCPNGHKIADWYGSDGKPLRRTDQPFYVEAKKCPACDAVELARNRDEAKRDDPAWFWVLVPRRTDDDEDDDSGAEAPIVEVTGLSAETVASFAAVEDDRTMD